MYKKKYIVFNVFQIVKYLGTFTPKISFLNFDVVHQILRTKL